MSTVNTARTVGRGAHSTSTFSRNAFWWEITATALLSFLLSLIALAPALRNITSAWGAGDTLSSYVNANQWNWLWFSNSTSFGYPLGMNSNLFPSIDITQNTFAQLVNTISGNPYLGINLLLVLSFPLVGALAYISIRLTGLRGPLAVALALTFTFIPFHFSRGIGHTYLGVLYSAVTAVILAQLIGSGRVNQWLKRDASRSRKNTVLKRGAIAALVLVTAWSGIYFAAFALILMATAWLWNLAQGQRGAALIRNAIPLLAIASLIVLAYIPALIARIADPPFAPLAVRLPYESVIFAGNLAAGVLPAPIGFLDFYNTKILEAVSAAPALENTEIANFGTVITFLALITIALAAFTSLRRNLGLLTSMLAVSILFFIPWGANYLFAGLVSPQIRAWNRFLPIILLIVLLLVATILANWSQQKKHNATKGSTHRRRNITAIWILATAIIAITTITQVLPFTNTYREATGAAAQTTRDAIQYTGLINNVIEQNCGVLQLPAAKYPENGNLLGMNDYEHFWTSLNDPTKSWTYGAVKNTSAAAWYNALPEIPDSATTDLLARSGFCGIHVDLRAFVRPAQARVLTELTERFGSPILTFTPKGQPYWAFFTINSNAELMQPTKWDQERKDFFYAPVLTPDLQSISPRGSKGSDYWWWTTKPTGIFTLTQLDPTVGINTISGSIEIPECAEELTTPVTVSLTQSPESIENSVQVTAPGAFSLTIDPTDLPDSQGLLEPFNVEISSELPGCTPAGGLIDQFVKVTNLQAR